MESWGEMILQVQLLYLNTVLIDQIAEAANIIVVCGVSFVQRSDKRA